MARPREVDPVDDAGEGFDTPRLGRSALWAGIAIVAMLCAFAAARSDIGLRRITEALNERLSPNLFALNQKTPASAPMIAELDAETRRLARAVQALSNDRDRIVTRLAAMERSIEVTGSVAPVPQPALPEAASPSAGPVLATVTLIPATAVEVTASSSLPETLAMPILSGAPTEQRDAKHGPAARQIAEAHAAAGSVVTQTQFAVELGAEPDMDAVRARWAAVRSQHGATLEGLRPLVAARETGRRGGIELRLVLGPLANAAAAARLCVVLGSAAGQGCQPGNYEGQQLAVR
jgi:hypothetical protein